MPDVRLIDANAYEYPGDLIHMPTVDAVPVVHGRWVREPRGIARCSYCDKGYRLTNGGANVLKFNYCPTAALVWTEVRNDENRC